jgi:ABC-type glycerol-3-phosphate transport system substrate-binding protein
MRSPVIARFAGLLTVLALVTVAAGTASARPAASGFPTGDVTITMFGSDELPQFQIEESLIKAWQKLHPNVKVEAQQAPLGPAFQKLSTELPTGGGPTIFSAFEPWIEGFVNYMAPAVPAAFGVSNQAGISNLYLPHALDAMTRAGKVYCLPSAAPVWSLMINKQEFTAAGLRIPQDVPHTWAQVAALQKRLTKYDANGHLVQRGFGIRYNAGPQWYSMLFVASVESQGAKVLDAKGNPLLTSPAAQKALTIFQQNAVAPTVTKAVQTSPYQDFADGLDVMSYGGANALSFVESLNPKMKGNVYVAQMPSLSGQIGGAPKYSFNYCVNKAASPDEQYAAWSLIDYMTSHAALYWKKTGAFSSRKTFFSDPAVKSAPYIGVWENELAHAQLLPQTKYWNQLQQAIVDAVQKVVFVHKSIPDALSEAQKEYQQAVG